MAVVASHVAHGRFEAGALGVDVFFVISGFIMWTVTADRSVAPRAFLADRATRIAPPYILLTLAVYGVGTTVPGAFPNMQTPFSHLALSLLFIPHPDPYGTWYPLIVPGWTLVYEAGFYLLFAACLLVPERHRAQICIIALAILMVASNKARLLEFAAGVALARWGLPIALAWDAHIPRWRLFLLLGDASYGIYLTHVFVVATVWRMFGALSLSDGSWIKTHGGVNRNVVAATWRVLSLVSTPLYAAVALVASAAVGVAWWRWVERPLTRLALATRREFA